MEEMSGRVMVCDAGSECWQERMWMNCGRKVKFLSAQHRTLAVSQQRRIIVAAKLLAEKRLVDEDAVGFCLFETNLTHSGKFSFLYLDVLLVNTIIVFTGGGNLLSLTAIDNNHHNIRIINLVRIDNVCCLSMKVDGNESLCLFVCLGCACHDFCSCSTGIHIPIQHQELKFWDIQMSRRP